MPVIQPSSPRSTIENVSSSLIITIPNRKDWLTISVMVFFLLSWACAELTMLGMGAMFLFGLLLGWGSSGAESAPAGVAAFVGTSLFGLFWFALWTFGGLAAIVYLLWLLTGAEKIEVDARAITVRRLILNIGRPKTYLAEHIKGLRAAANPPYSWWWWSSRMYYWGWLAGTITFDYGARTIRCGSGIDEAEAKAIIRTIQERFPQYQTTEKTLK